MKRENSVCYYFPPTKEKTGSHVWDDGIMFVWTEVTSKAGLTKQYFQRIVSLTQETAKC